MKLPFPIYLGAAALIGLVAAIWTGAELPVRLALKGTASAMFVLTALLVPRPNPGYFRFILLGLVFGLAGDVLLTLNAEGAFLAGLVSFLAGHALYAVAFFRLIPPRRWISFKTIPIWLVSIGLAVHLGPHAGKMLIPVIVYIVVITVMVSGAIALLGDENQARGFPKLILTASLLFFFSDYLVARNNFIGTAFINTLVLLPTYYAAQFMFAYSVGKVGSGKEKGRIVVD